MEDMVKAVAAESAAARDAQDRRTREADLKSKYGKVYRLGITVGNKLTEILGLTDTANLTRL